MLRKIIKSLNNFETNEKDRLISIVEDLYFYWNKFEILKDAVIIVKNFNKPIPLKYMSPLSELPRLDMVINYNAFVVAFINAACFFEPKKSRNDDRFLLDFLKKCNEESELLFRLSEALYKRENQVVPYTKISFITMIKNLENELDIEIGKQYIKEIKKYRHKVLSHHTYIKQEDISEQVSDYLMDAVKFLEKFLLVDVSKIITQVYNSNLAPVQNSIDILRRKIKPDLLDIVRVNVIFKIDSEEVKNEILKDNLFEDLKSLIGTHEYHEDKYNIELTFFRYTSFYDRKENQGIDDNGQKDLIYKIIKKYQIFGSSSNESIMDH